MATSSILKDCFYVKNLKDFERLKKDVEMTPHRKTVVESPNLKKGKEKLNTFTFR